MDENVISLMLEVLNKNRLSHAVLIESGSETSRRKTAEKLAKAMVCSGQDEKPCGFCSDCKKADARVHPDIIFYSGGSTPGSFKVDLVREISAGASVLPNEADRKVYVLERAETMSASAQNALLKILEEPPGYVSFIILTASKNAMLQTVLSRTTVYTLDEELSDSDEERLKARSTAEKILTAASSDSEKELLKLTAEFEKDRNLLKLCATELYRLCSETVLRKTTASDIEPSEIELSFSTARLFEISEHCNKIIKYADANMNSNLLASLFCAGLIS